MDGTVTRITCRRSHFGFRLDKKHRFDLAFWRHYRRVREAVREFRPDMIHITGPSDAGQLGALVAGRLGIPLAASWHTNLHEYAEQRAASMLDTLPFGLREKSRRAVRESTLAVVLRFYGMAKLLFAPNPELMNLLENGTGKPTHPMRRGVDTVLFTPQHRDRMDDAFVIGFVGRLTVEKNIRFLAEIESMLHGSGIPNVRFLIVGQGAEEGWLRANMRTAKLPGVLRGEALARAYANMDAFVFPSRTDTFGNVVLEALASGVPAIVTDSGGPQFLVSHGETGFIARSSGDFVSCVRRLVDDPQCLREMREAARKAALGASWDRIFVGLYANYEEALRPLRFAPNSTNLQVKPGMATSQLS